MAVRAVIKLSLYHDSVTLMNIARELRAVPGVDDAALVSKKTWLEYLHPDNRIRDFEKLKNLAVPTLVIIGEKDTVIPIDFQEHVANTIPNATKVLLLGEGHAAAIENPAKVLSEINSFLRISYIHC